MRAPTTPLSLVTLALLIACGGGDSGGGSTGPTSTATTVARFGGDSQVAPVSTTLPDSLAVLVTDTGGHPAADVTVSWTAVGGGSVFPASSKTDINGIAKASRTLGATAGHAKTNATVSGLAPFQFDAVGQVQGGVTISSNGSVTLTDTVLGTLVDPEARPSVKVVDQNGHPVAGVNVTWTATGGGSVATGTVPTDTAGVSTVGYTFGATKGTGYQAHATVTGLVNSPISFTLTATPGAPISLAKVAGDTGIAAPGTMISLTVKVLDGHGNTVPKVRVDWSAATGGGSVSAATDSTGAAGTAQITRTLGSGFGGQTTTATASTLSGPPSVVFTTTAVHLVKVVNDAFVANAISIPVGDSIAWQWQGVTVAHNITFSHATGVPANEGDRTTGTVFRVFGTAGTFTYQCTNHPGMTGTVTVTP